MAGLIVVLLVSAVSPGCVSAPSEPVVSFSRPRLIVLISLDTLRADRLDLYGYHRVTAPTLTALADEGVVFDTAMAQSGWTLSSHKSMFNGKRPLRLLAEHFDADIESLTELEDPEGFMTSAFRSIDARLAAAMRERGYTPLALTGGGYMSAGWGFDEHFAVYDDGAIALKTVVPRALKVLREQPDGDLFLLLHTYAVHSPYVTFDEYDLEFCGSHDEHVDLKGKFAPTLRGMDLQENDLRGISDHYDAGIRSADANLKKFFEGLRRYGMYDDALIVVTSDHGEALGEGGRLGHGDIYLEQLLVPLIVKPPVAWSITPGRREEAVELIDLYPTLLDAAGLRPQESVDGQSLLGVLAGRKTEGRTDLVAQTIFHTGVGEDADPTVRALYRPPGRFLRDAHAAGQRTLFAVGTEAAPTTGLLPLGSTRERHALAASLRVFDPPVSGKPLDSPDATPVSDAMRERLRALGYVDDSTQPVAEP